MSKEVTYLDIDLTEKLAGHQQLIQGTHSMYLCYTNKWRRFMALETSTAIESPAEILTDENIAKFLLYLGQFR